MKWRRFLFFGGILTLVFLPLSRVARALTGDPVPDPRAATVINVSDISCPLVHFCRAAASYQIDANSRHVLILDRHDNAWQIDASLQPNANFDYAQITTLSCSSEDFCFAFGSYSQKQGPTLPWVEEYNNKLWHQVSLPLIGQNVITDVACTSATFCMAVGGFTNGVTATHSRIYKFDGVSWSQDNDLQLAQIGMVGKVVCQSSSSCVIAGSSTSISDPHYALARFNNGAWTTDVGFDSTGRGVFQDVSCITLQDCTALGHDYLTGGLVVARHSVQGWVIVDRSTYSPILPGHAWQALGCTAQQCFLAGANSLYNSQSAGVHGLIDQAVTNNWQTAAVEPPQAFGSDAQHIISSKFTAMSCLADNFCLAMGVYSSSGQPHIYAATYDGHKWTVEDPFAKTASTVLPATTKGAGTVLNSEISSMHQSKGLGYVAFGDSITTGQSIANCQDNRLLSPWGCLPGDLPAMPYPNRVAAALGYKYQDSVIWYQQALPFLPTTGLVRVGIWGATLQAATQAQRQKHNSSGAWVPQLLAVQQTQGLVTGSLGVNDLHFSDVVKWVKLYFQPGNDHITPAVQEIIQQRAADFDAMFDALKIAKSNGAKVIVTLYYNPYDTASNSCQDLRSIGATIVNNLDDELMRRSQQAGLRVADFRPAFQGHGAGSSTRYVFGKQCSAISAIADWLPSWMGGGGGQQNLARGFDPHPNNSGTAAMATAILKEYER